VHVAHNARAVLLRRHVQPLRQPDLALKRASAANHHKQSRKEHLSVEQQDPVDLQEARQSQAHQRRTRPTVIFQEQDKGLALFASVYFAPIVCAKRMKSVVRQFATGGYSFFSVFVPSPRPSLSLTAPPVPVEKVHTRFVTRRAMQMLYADGEQGAATGQLANLNLQLNSFAILPKVRAAEVAGTICWPARSATSLFFLLTPSRSDSPCSQEEREVLDLYAVAPKASKTKRAAKVGTRQRSRIPLPKVVTVEVEISNADSLV
jgi:hypothetical protein